MFNISSKWFNSEGSTEGVYCVFTVCIVSAFPTDHWGSHSLTYSLKWGPERRFKFFNCCICMFPPLPSPSILTRLASAPLFSHPPPKITALSLVLQMRRACTNSPARPGSNLHFRCMRVWGLQPLSRRLGRVLCTTMTSDQEKTRQRLKQLLRKPGNGNCADCGAAGRLEWNHWQMLDTF